MRYLLGATEHPDSQVRVFGTYDGEREFIDGAPVGRSDGFPELSELAFVGEADGTAVRSAVGGGVTEGVGAPVGLLAQPTLAHKRRMRMQFGQERSSGKNARITKTTDAADAREASQARRCASRLLSTQGRDTHAAN